MPSSVPSTKPSSVAESVTQAWIDEAALLVGGVSNTVFQSSASDLVRRRQHRPSCAMVADEDGRMAAWCAAAPFEGVEAP